MWTLHLFCGTNRKREETWAKGLRARASYRLGEIDVVARDLKSGEVIFAEVKTRKKGTSNSEAPELAISRGKYRKLTKIISNYLRKNNLLDCPYRLDAIAIELDMRSRKASLKHLKYIYY